MVAIDAGHLKGKWNRVMLTLSCKDSNSRFIHVVTVVTPKENASSYRFLFQQAKRNPELATFLNDRRTTFFSDGHMGSPAAMRAEVPLAQDSTCVTHVINNLCEAVSSARFDIIMKAFTDAPSTWQ